MEFYQEYLAKLHNNSSSNSFCNSRRRLAEIGRNRCGKRTIGAGPGGTQAKVASLEEIRGKYDERFVRDDSGVGDGIETGPGTRRRSAEAKAGAEHSSATAHGKVTQSRAADQTAREFQ